jgi:galactosylceramide sulfotransferase
MWRAYLQPDPLLVVTLREPMSQAVSAFNYFELDNASYPKSRHPHLTWEEHLTWLENLPDEVRRDYGCGRFRNPQAYDLGWYEYVGWTAEHDHNETIIQQWIASLDINFDKSGGVILTEYFDEGIVLLRKRLQVEVNEMTYIYKNAGSNHTLPSEEQWNRLRSLYPVDLALYDHFSTSFWKYWRQDEEENNKQLDALRQANVVFNVQCLSDSPPPLCAVWKHSTPWLRENWDALHKLVERTSYKS